MRIKNATIKNLGPFDDLEMSFSDVVIVAGENGFGKSTLISALGMTVGMLMRPQRYLLSVDFLNLPFRQLSDFHMSCNVEFEVSHDENIEAVYEWRIDPVSSHARGIYLTRTLKTELSENDRLRILDASYKPVHVILGNIENNVAPWVHGHFADVFPKFQEIFPRYKCYGRSDRADVAITSRDQYEVMTRGRKVLVKELSKGERWVLGTLGKVMSGRDLITGGIDGQITLIDDFGAFLDGDIAKNLLEILIGLGDNQIIVATRDRELNGIVSSALRNI